MLYTGIALGLLGGMFGIAIGAAALVGGALGRVSGGDISMGAAALAMALSFVALAGTLNMRKHWRAGVILDAVCGVLGCAVLPVYFIAPAIMLLLPAALYVAGDAVLRRRAAGQVKRAAREARAQYARTDNMEIKQKDAYDVKAAENSYDYDSPLDTAQYAQKAHEESDDGRAETDNSAGINAAVPDASSQSISSAAERAMYGCDSIIDVPGNALEQAMSAGVSMENEVAEKAGFNVENEKTKSEPPHKNIGKATISRGTRVRQSRKRR